MTAPVTLDLTKYIDTQFFGERPHITARRIPIATLAYATRDNGWRLSELAENFTLSDAEALAALLYYETHRTEVDAQEAQYQAELDKLQDRYGNR